MLRLSSFKSRGDNLTKIACLIGLIVVWASFLDLAGAQAESNFEKSFLETSSNSYSHRADRRKRRERRRTQDLVDISREYARKRGDRWETLERFGKRCSGTTRLKRQLSLNGFDSSAVTCGRICQYNEGDDRVRGFMDILMDERFLCTSVSFFSSDPYKCRRLQSKDLNGIYGQCL